MTGDARYRRHNVVDVDAAVVGISRQRWTDVAEENAEAAQAIMATSGFDVLPVARPGEAVTACYRTERWGDFGAIGLVAIEDGDRVPYTMSVRDVVRRFAEEPARRYFFLADEDGEVTGLLTVANLNCSQARVWLYALVVELEVTLANFLQAEHADENEEALIRLVPASAVGQRVQDRLDGMDRALTEYLYLSNLVSVIDRQKRYGALGYTRRKLFQDDFGRLNSIRNLVAHPVRSLVETVDDVGRLWTAVQTAEAALDALDAHRPWSADARGPSEKGD